ncbi:GNAT family N-acetyltransferase [Cryobacterium sp. Y29]|uniref:GNAT family N-acetyltransferase n=1 Tax=Cryobacterium sp. Y29 TaxID=2048285 RepID=UPI0018EA8F39|nr:GNAT family N-acetyltransferase [Cryobacterium sp. Y29]
MGACAAISAKLYGADVELTSSHQRRCSPLTGYLVGATSNVERMMPVLPIVVSAAAPASAEAESVSLRYYDDIVSRYYGRPALQQEIVAAQAGYSSDDLVAPTGLLLLARQGRAVLGCAGMRIRPGDIGEVTRVFVEPAARGQGVGRLLLQNLESESRALGLTALRLDTRTDLIEARSLYASVGFIEGEAHNTDPYANHWFRKELR